MKLLMQSIRLTLVFTALTGIAYPLAMTGLAQALFHDKANGSLMTHDGNIVGSELLAQQFTGPKYFWPRPSANSYGSGASGINASSGSNLGPTSQTLQQNVANNAKAFRDGNQLATNAVVPSDMLFASASGLDPHISPKSAQLQIARVAAARAVKKEQIESLVDRFTQGPQCGIFGESRVNVLRLNIALDNACP